MKTRPLLCLLGALIAASTAHAQITYKSYKAAKATGGAQWNLMKAYFQGAGYAYGYSNVTLEAQKKPPFYCPPLDLALGPENFIDILEQQIGRMKPLKDDSEIDVILLFGLVHTFPCKR